MHAEEELAEVEGWKVPMGHCVHEAEPMLLKVPAGHAEHEEKAPGLGLKVPAAHGAHEVAAGVERDPAGHCWHADIEDDPLLGLKVPKGQRVQRFKELAP